MRSNNREYYFPPEQLGLADGPAQGEVHLKGERLEGGGMDVDAENLETASVARVPGREYLVRGGAEGDRRAVSARAARRRDREEDLLKDLDRERAPRANVDR